MLKSITVTNYLGESITLELRSPEKSGFFIRGIDGLGPTKGIINTTNVLSFDGTLYNSSRLSARNLVLDLGFLYNGSETIESIRQKSYKYFPVKKPVIIKIETDNRVGITTGYVESNEPDIFSKEEASVISILCPNAYFLDENVVQTRFTGVVSAFEFPFENTDVSLPMLIMGEVLLDTAKSLFYEGDVDTGFKLYAYFNGPVNDLTIYNITRRETFIIRSDILIELTGSDFAAGDMLTIVTLKGEKSITLFRGGENINVMNIIGANSDWLQISQGDNVVLYTADSGINNVQLTTEHQVLYEGL